MIKKSKNEFCPGCGVNVKKSHFQNCPVKYGLGDFGAFGIPFRPKDSEYNLNLGRIKMLFAIRARAGHIYLFPPSNNKLSEKENLEAVTRVIYLIGKFSISRAESTINNSKSLLKKYGTIRTFLFASSLKKKIKEMNKLIKLTLKFPKLLDSSDQKKIFDRVQEITRLYLSLD